MTDSETLKLCDEVDEYCAKATPGPFEVETSPLKQTAKIWAKSTGGSVSGVIATMHIDWPHDDQRAEQIANSELFARSRTDLPKLVSMLREKLEGERTMREALQERITESYEKLMSCKNTDGCDSDECDYHSGAFNALCAVYSRVFNEAPPLPFSPEVKG